MSDDVVGYRDRKGQRIGDVATWAALHEDPTYRFLADDTLPNGTRVVTVWEGIVSPVCEGLFYTGVLVEGKGHVRVEETPTQTEDEAMAAHQAALERWSK